MAIVDPEARYHVVIRNAKYPKDESVDEFTVDAEELAERIDMKADGGSEYFNISLEPVYRDLVIDAKPSSRHRLEGHVTIVKWGDTMRITNDFDVVAERVAG